jgi:hypothetical protein
MPVCLPRSGIALLKIHNKRTDKLALSAKHTLPCMLLEMFTLRLKHSLIYASKFVFSEVFIKLFSWINSSNKLKKRSKAVRSSSE